MKYSILILLIFVISNLASAEEANVYSYNFVLELEHRVYLVDKEIVYQNDIRYLIFRIVYNKDTQNFGGRKIISKVKFYVDNKEPNYKETVVLRLDDLYLNQKDYDVYKELSYKNH